MLAASGSLPTIFYSEHVQGGGGEFFQTACNHHLEGIVSKEADAPHRFGRSDSWLKCKCTKRQEFVVGGWQPRQNDEGDLGALLVGYYEDDRLLFAGKVGTGFDALARKELVRSLTGLARATDPFEETPNEYRKHVRWVEPQMVVEVEFTQFTADGLLRHPSFQGVRRDKKPTDVGLEVPRDVPEPGAIAKAKSRWRRN